MRHLWEKEAEAIFRLALAVEYRDNHTGEHTWRVALYSRIIVEALGLDAEFCQCLYLAAPLHDVGKVAVLDGLLLKKRPMDDAEFAVIRTHPTVGKRILGGSESKLIRFAAEIGGSHHEHWDGKGYPNGLTGSATPLSARNVAVADVFDALTTVRPCKPAMGPDEALHCDEAERSKHFDPACVDAFRTAWTSVQALGTVHGGRRLAGLVRSTDSYARAPEMPREAADADWGWKA